MNHKLVNGMKLWIGSGNTITLFFLLRKDLREKGTSDGTLKQHYLLQVQVTYFQSAYLSFNK
jgi:hypothetical protein